MRIWRICRREYSQAALEGEGGLWASGRWHHKGHRVVYCAEHASLAALETLVHSEPALAPADLVLVEVDAPEHLAVTVVDAAALPANWHETPAPSVLQDVGTRWLQSRASVLLCVPSAVIAAERNYLVNPEHPEAGLVRVVSTTAFRFDSRLVRAT
jgi:RES domain-containing protein